MGTTIGFRRHARTATRLWGLGLACSLVWGSSGCITLKPEHDALVLEVDKLKKQQASRTQKLEATLADAEAQMAKVQDQLDRAAEILRSNQATLGVRVENMELEVADVRGVAEDSQNELAALAQNIEEAREQLDKRLTKLEDVTNQTQSIPEGKTELLTEAERELKKRDYKRSRLLFRTFLSRYPADAKEAQVRFKVGLTLFSERDYRSALGEFYWIVQNAPESESIHDALYYSGLAFAKIGQCEKAVAYFNALAEKKSKAPDRYKQQASKQIETLKKDDGKMCEDRDQSES